MSTTSQRRLRPIQEHIDNGNWKQALQLCEKYQKKGEKSDAFLTTRALVLASQPEQASQKQGKDALLQLCNKNPPITDEETVDLLDNALASLNIGETNALRLWERAASAKPGDESLLEKWIYRAITEENWISAQKAAMTLRKTFPKERQYEFWVVFMCYHIYKDTKSDEQSRKIFGTMAYKMLEKAVSQTPVVDGEKAEMTPGKAIYTAEELALLVSVYTDLGHFPEALSLLQGDSLGVKSRLFKQDPALLQELLLSVMRQSQDHANVVDLCCLLIGLSPGMSDGSEASAHKPWCENNSAWSSMVVAAIESNNQDVLARVKSLLEAYRKSHPRSRHASVAYLMLLREMLLHGHDVGGLLLESCTKMYKTYYDKATCIPDIRDAVASLDDEALKRFDDFIIQFTDEKTANGSASLISSVQANQIELAYTFRVSPSLKPEIFGDIICQSLRLAKDWVGLTTEASPSDINIMGAAISSLVGMSNTGSHPKSHPRVYLLYAHLITRFLLAHSPTTYPLSLLSIRLSQTFGLFSLALKSIEGLSIKSLQWESFAHMVMNRISSTHPHNVRGSKSSDGIYLSPQSALYSALVVYKRAGELKTNAVMQGLNHQSYRNADQALTFSHNLQDSICRRIYYIDSQRIKRLTGSEGNSWQTYDSSSFDGRNCSVFPNYEAPQLPKLEERLRLGPLPKETWTCLMLLCDQVYRLLVGGPTESSFAQVIDLKMVSRMVEAQQTDMSMSPELTEPEKLSVSLQLTAGLAACGAFAKGLVADDTWDKSISEMVSKLDEVLQHGKQHHSIKPDTPLIFSLDWEFFHWAYSILDTLKYIKAFISFMDAVKKTPSQPTSRSKTSNPAQQTKITLDPPKRTHLKELITKIENSIHDQARGLKDRLSRQGALGEMLDATLMNKSENDEKDTHGCIVKSIEDLMGTAEIETALAEIRDSWEEGLERVLSVRVMK